MKKTFLSLAFIFSLALTMPSCYVHTYNVGNGPQSGVKIKKPNHYFIYGLAPGKTADPIDMADGASDYSVTTKHSFVDGLLNAITFGIYTPTTTIVTK